MTQERLHVQEHKVLEHLLESHEDLSLLDDEALQLAIAESASRYLFDASWTLNQRHQMIRRIFDRLRGLDVIQPLLDDPSISEIMINHFDRIYFERNGKLYKSDLTFESDQHLLQVLGGAYARKNRALSISQPANNLILDDGSRVHGIIWPLSVDGPVFTIRKFTSIKPDAKTLIDGGFIPESMYRLLEQAVIDRRSIFICGGTGSGKTTLLNILSSSIPTNERVVTIEDSCELQLQGLENLIRLEAQSEDQHRHAATIFDIGALIREALRMRPDRIIVGEIRGLEAADMLEAMNTGHAGTLSTGHGNTCRDMSRRIANLVLSATRLPYSVILADIASAFDLFVHLERNAQGERYVTEICETAGCTSSEVLFKTLYHFQERRHP